MKVIFSHCRPFFLAHGGSQTLIEELMGGLRNLGVDVEPERWWDENQTGDILHFVARPNLSNVVLARQKGFKIVITELLDAVAARSWPKLCVQRAIISAVRQFAPGMMERVAWDVYQNSDAVICAVRHELKVAEFLFSSPPDRGHVIPWGMPAAAITALAQPQREEDYLISVATIAERKNSILLARAAFQAEVPIVFAGKPYSESDPYFQEFKSLVDGKFVRYAGFVSEAEKQRLLRGARGFALVSQFESGCIAVYEAAAAGLPLFLTDAQWARSGYPGADPICFVNPKKAGGLAAALKDFYATAHRLPRHTFPILNWDEIAKQYVAIYERILTSPRS